jgi:hypothetical protein
MGHIPIRCLWRWHKLTSSSADPAQIPAIPEFAALSPSWPKGRLALPGTAHNTAALRPVAVWAAKVQFVENAIRIS